MTRELFRCALALAAAAVWATVAVLATDPDFTRCDTDASCLAIELGVTPEDLELDEHGFLTGRVKP